MQANNKVIVIGAGIAGLATAIRLAANGASVTVFEKNNYAGGKLSAFVKEGFHFDAGPSLFTKPSLLKELFAAANANMDDYITVTKLEETCRYFFADGSQLVADADATAFAQQLKNIFGEDEIKVQKYLKNAANTYNSIGEMFTQHSLHKLSTFRFSKLIPALLNTKLPYLFSTVHKYNKKYFKHANTQQLFNRFSTYNGSNPYKAPAMLSMIPHLEMNDGTYYPQGGMINITNALEKLAKEKNVEIVLSSKVDSIIEHGGKTYGVLVNGKIIKANTVVSNMDAYLTYKHLLKRTAKAKKILKQERSSSAFIFYWGINKTFSQLGLHNILFSKNYAAEFKNLFTGKAIPNDFTVYINITSKLDPTHAPVGNENWFVMINAPAHSGQNWPVDEIRQKTIKIINEYLQTQIQNHIVTEAFMSPEQIEERTLSHTGSLYGTSSNSKWAAFMRHPNQAPGIKGLYFVGGSVHPGGGIPLCLSSAQITSNLIIPKLNN
jgi:phytoene desaturase